MKNEDPVTNETFEEYTEIPHQSETAAPPIWPSKRLLVTFLIFLGLINMNFLKGCVSIAMVEMTSAEFIVEGNQTTIRSAQFNWETTIKATVLNMYSYGGLFSFILSSLPSKLGGSITFGTIMMTMSIFTVFVPASIYLDFRCFLALRFLTGFLENIAFASTADIFRQWVPLAERSRLMSFSYNGIYIGAALLHSTCGFIAHRGGWSMVFYATGFSTMIWALIWLLFVPNDPANDKWISKKELSHIIADTEIIACPITKTSSTPYKRIFLSIPFWAVSFSRICLGESLAVIFICLPLFVKDATQKSTDLVGFISSIPSTICAILIPILGTIMDHWKKSSDITATKMHKIILGTNFFFGGCLLAAAAWISDFVLYIVCFTVVRTLLSCSALVLLMVMVHMAPNHSSAVTALTTFWYSMGNILAQFFIGIITVHHSSEDWNEVFFLTAAVMIFSALSFTLYGSSEPQAWSKTIAESDPEENIVKLLEANVVRMVVELVNREKDDESESFRSFVKYRIGTCILQGDVKDIEDQFIKL